LVEEGMKQITEYLNPESTIADAANMMLKEGVRALPVLNEADSLIGIITKGDLTRFVANGFKIEQNNVD
jgi:CBS domain-containing protein